MTLSNRQHQLFDAVTDIDPAYLAEALDHSTHRRSTVLRFTAVAAVLALIFGCFAFWPDSDSGPIFTTTVSANDMDTTITVSADRVPDYTPDSGHIKDTLDPAWMNFDLFCVTVRMDGAEPEYLADSYVTVEYDGDLYTSDAQTGQICVIFSQDQSPGVLCRIYGWAQDLSVSKLNFTVNVYHKDTEADALLCTQSFTIFYNDSRLIVNREVSASSGASWTITILPTQELVDMIAYNDDPPPYGFLSRIDHDYLGNYTRNYYSEIIAVLDTRDDAASCILNTLITMTDQFNSLSEEEFYDSFRSDCYYSLQLLLFESYYDLLTDEEVLTLKQLFINMYGDDTMFEYFLNGPK